MQTFDPDAIPGSVLRDHRDGRAGWMLPRGLDLAAGDDGSPELRLTRFTTATGDGRGGLLDIALRLRYPTMLPNIAPVEPAAVRARLVLRALGTRGVGDWRQQAAEDATWRLGPIALDAEQATLMARADAAHADQISIDALVDYFAAAPPLPRLVNADAAALQDALLVQLGDQPVTADAVEAAVLGLPEGLGDPLHATVIGPGDVAVTQLRREVAARCVADLFHPAGEAGTDLVARPQVAGTLRYDLLTTRVQRATVALSWSLGDAYAQLSSAMAATLQQTLRVPDLLDDEELVVANTLPVDGNAVRRVRATIDYVDVRGVRAYLPVAFAAGEPVARRLSIMQLAGAERRDVGISTTVTLGPTQPGGWPRTVTTPRGARDHLVVLDPVGLGAWSIRVSADPSVFATTTQVDVACEPPDRANAVELTASAPAGHLSGPGRPPETLMITARSADGASAAWRRAVSGPAVRLVAGDVAAIDPMLHTFAAEPGTVPGGTTLRVRDGVVAERVIAFDGSSRTVALWARDRLHPVDAAFRLEIPVTGAGVRVSRWQAVSSPAVVIDGGGLVFDVQPVEVP